MYSHLNALDAISKVVVIIIMIIMVKMKEVHAVFYTKQRNKEKKNLGEKLTCVGTIE